MPPVIHCPTEKKEILATLQKIRIHTRSRLYKHTDFLKSVIDKGIGAEGGTEGDSMKKLPVPGKEGFKQSYNRVPQVNEVNTDLLFGDNLSPFYEHTIGMGAPDINSDYHYLTMMK
jgi:hypothetical protein